MALEMKKSPKNVAIANSYCNFSFEKLDFYFFQKLPLYKNVNFLFCNSTFKVQYENLL